VSSADLQAIISVGHSVRVHHRKAKRPSDCVKYSGGKGGGMDSKCYQDQVLKPVLKAFYMQMNHERQMVNF
jgi:hypothetical protein